MDSTTPKTDAAGTRIGELAAKWKGGEISAITFAASAEVALDPLRGIERENSEQREEGLRLRRCLHDIHGKISRGEALGVGDLNQIENALLAI
jgi:hypothetical protein